MRRLSAFTAGIYIGIHRGNGSIFRGGVECQGYNYFRCGPTICAEMPLGNFSFSGKYLEKEIRFFPFRVLTLKH